MMQDVKTEVESIVRPIITGEGFDLIETKLARYKNKYRLQVFVDSDHGVNIDDCAGLSSLIGTALDMTDLFADGYVLEVSSSGTDRPLTTLRDFQRKIGKEMEIEYISDEKPSRIRGVLISVQDDHLIVQTKKAEERIALMAVKQGKLII